MPRAPCLPLVPATAAAAVGGKRRRRQGGGVSELPVEEALEAKLVGHNDGRGPRFPQRRPERREEGAPPRLEPVEAGAPEGHQHRQVAVGLYAGRPSAGRDALVHVDDERSPADVGKGPPEEVGGVEDLPEG